MTQEKVFSDTFSTTALAVYEKFESAETLAKMDLQELTAFIMEKGKNRFPDPDAVAKALQKAARSSYRLPKTVNDSVNQVLAISITSIRALESQIKAFDKAITKQMELLPNVLISNPFPVLVRYFLLELWLRSETSTVFKIRLPLLNMRALHGSSTNQATLKPRQQE